MLRVVISEVRSKGARLLNSTWEEKTDYILMEVEGGVLWFLAKPKFRELYMVLE